MAQASLRKELNEPAATFIRGGAWNGSSAGFMAGETLLLNLAEMEKAWLERDARALEVTRTVSLAQVYRELGDDGFELKEKLADMLNNGSGSGGVNQTEVKIAGGQLQASVQLSRLDIGNDYPPDWVTIARLNRSA
ncbi:MAG: Unknown, probable insecticidal toxin [uncultured Paraburkholderia sp.]|nr:MAG: Unknown, probable insecticidal toxin [uncultured Paraburkholderia sp.]